VFFTDFAATGLFFRNEPTNWWQSRPSMAFRTSWERGLLPGMGHARNGGSIEKTISRMRWGLAAKRATGAEIKVPYYFGLLAEAHRRANRIADGMSLLDEALELVERTDERWYEAELYRLMGEMLIIGSDRNDAKRWLCRALETAHTQGAKRWEVRAATSMARLWRDQAKRTEARALLAPIYACFTEGFDTRDLKEVAALLAELT